LAVAADWNRLCFNQQLEFISESFLGRVAPWIRIPSIYGSISAKLEKNRTKVQAGGNQWQ